MATQNLLRTHKDKQIFSGGKIRFVTAHDLIKLLKQIKLHGLLLTCAPIFGLPSHISMIAQLQLYE